MVNRNNIRIFLHQERSLNVILTCENTQKFMLSLKSNAFKIYEVSAPLVFMEMRSMVSLHSKIILINGCFQQITLLILLILIRWNVASCQEYGLIPHWMKTLCDHNHCSTKLPVEKAWNTNRECLLQLPPKIYGQGLDTKSPLLYIVWLMDEEKQNHHFEPPNPGTQSAARR